MIHEADADARSPAMTPAKPADGFPPLEPLTALVLELERRQVRCALGGSGLLATLGLGRHAHDWDLTTDAPLERVVLALEGTPGEWVGPNGIHADHKIRLEGGAIELIVGFALRAEGGIVSLATLETRRWNAIPVGSPEVWAIAYALMGRTPKADLLFGWLEEHGASQRAVDRLATQPLPQALRQRLAELPNA